MIVPLRSAFFTAILSLSVPLTIIIWNLRRPNPINHSALTRKQMNFGITPQFRGETEPFGRTSSDGASKKKKKEYARVFGILMAVNRLLSIRQPDKLIWDCNFKLAMQYKQRIQRLNFYQHLATVNWNSSSRASSEPAQWSFKNPHGRLYWPHILICPKFKEPDIRPAQVVLSRIYLVARFS